MEVTKEYMKSLTMQIFNVYNQRGELEKSGFSSYQTAATFCISRGRYGDWQIKQSNERQRDYVERSGNYY